MLATATRYGAGAQGLGGCIARWRGCGRYAEYRACHQQHGRTDCHGASVRAMGMGPLQHVMEGRQLTIAHAPCAYHSEPITPVRPRPDPALAQHRPPWGARQPVPRPMIAACARGRVSGARGKRKRGSNRRGCPLGLTPAIFERVETKALKKWWRWAPLNDSKTRMKCGESGVAALKLPPMLPPLLGRSRALMLNGGGVLPNCASHLGRKASHDAKA